MDSMLNCKVYTRASVLNKALLATYPAVNGKNCIVVGTPELTHKSTTAWIITLLHEHFHQYQFATPQYYQKVEQINLTGGDRTGMWMLNYPFPYDSAVVLKKYAIYTHALQSAMLHTLDDRFSHFYKKVKHARNSFLKILHPKDARYFSFQVWQEGIARYTEYAFLRELRESNHINNSHKEAYDSLMHMIWKNEMDNLIHLPLQQSKRVHFYSVGFAEGLLFDKIQRRWKEMYLKRLFSLWN